MGLLYKRNCELTPDMVMPEGMQRVALAVEYNGTEFQGFQRQVATARTVQAELERALSSIANEPVTLVCAGRTDAGVHATQQVIHFDTLAQRPEKAWVLGMNAQLPDDVKVVWAQAVSSKFHARFSATARTYRYVLYSSRTRPALMRDQVTWSRYKLDVQAMIEAAQYLVGEHDFTSYRAVHCQAKNPVREIKYIRVQKVGELITVEVKANAFLHHMVRNIIGVLLEVGRGAEPANWAFDVLKAKDRTVGATTAKSAGLYFVAAEYPEEFGVTSEPLRPFFLA